MTISILDLIKSLNKAYRLIKPKRADLEKFKVNLIHLLSHIDEKESEENVKIHLMDFLKNTFYHPDFLVATKGRADLVIHTGKDSNSPPGVLFEVKRPSNKSEMVTRENLNARAMHELILYFLRERFENKNHSLTHLIITNIYEWFVFDASLFERVFTQNKELQKAYQGWVAGQKVSTNTQLFYNEIAKPFLEELNKEISFTYYDIRDFKQWLKPDIKNDKKLIPLYKFFTPVNLLKLEFINDSNSLDKGFFKELLHIIGLEETKAGGKKIIQRLEPGKREPGSMLENVINILEVEDTVSRISDAKYYGSNKEEQLFSLGLELCITWVNRILFLKLLEAQLIKYHRGNEQFKFLDVKTIRDYDELYKLFFQVLAKEPKERSPQINQKYQHIPYLNSSLFEISALEEKTVRINALDDYLDIKIYKDSVFRKNSIRAGQEEMNTLHYLLEFLEAYDFASVGKEEVQEENKTIINAAVLGLVFEKINGYKDGSIYTPGAVTMYLCRETIRRAVVRKFNDTYQWNCETVADVANSISGRRNTGDILEFNQVIESIKIADPAVGSGHFLVSSLNELIVVKSELNILADEHGKILSGIEISIANDELLANYTDTQDFFEYQISEKSSQPSSLISPQIQRIQKTLFNEKRKIIEGCLFGVDINPNSVKICQLRLWIELLKNAYYKEETGFKELETLPNIDINIKTGNSLLNKYDLAEDLTDVFNKQKYSVKDYQSAVAAYKEESNKTAKEEFRKFIQDIKNQFRETVSRRDVRRKKLSEFRGKLALIQDNFDLFGKKRTEAEVAVQVHKLNSDIDKVEKEIKEIESNAIYKYAFEWRFEFPEVLNEKGDFAGFEVIIGNPPYIQLQKMGKDADALQQGNYETFARTGDIYCLFYEQAIKLLKPGYFFGYITSNKWMRANYGQALRQFLLEKSNPELLVDFGGYQVFDSATVDTNLLIGQKEIYSGSTKTCLLDKSLGSLEKMSVFIGQHTNITNTLNKESSWVVLNEIEARIKRKIETIGVPLKEWDIQINYGIKTGFNEAFIIDSAKRKELLNKCPKADSIIRPILRGRDIKSYSIKDEQKWIIFTRRGIDIESYPSIKEHLLQYYHDLKPRKENDVSGRKPGPYKWYEIQDNVAYYKDFDKEKIVWIELTDKPNFALDRNGYYINNTIFFITGNRLKYLLAFLNSRLSEWYFDKIAATSGVGTRRWIKIYIDQICIPYPQLETEEKLNSLVDSMYLEQSAYVRTKIDKEIYNIFSLSTNEIEVLQNAVL